LIFLHERLIFIRGRVIATGGPRPGMRRYVTIRRPRRSSIDGPPMGMRRPGISGPLRAMLPREPPDAFGAA
jgi:hypothetical protein